MPTTYEWYTNKTLKCQASKVFCNKSAWFFIFIILARDKNILLAA